VDGEIDGAAEQRVLDFLTNSPLPPISESGRSWSRSPSVLITTMWHGGPPAAAIRAATVFACHSAS